MERKITKIAAKPKLQRVRKKRVAAYARVSAAKDATFHSLSAQISYYSDYIQRHFDWEFCGIYADEAITGTTDKRPQFTQMIDECRNRKIDMIITKSITRFARNTVMLLSIVRELKGFGVDVFFEKENIHTVSYEGELMLTILASFAQEESLSASENQKWRIRKCYEQGKNVQWRYQYGYRIKQNDVQVNTVEAKIVREIFSRAASNESFSSIARDMREREVPLLNGGKWDHWTVSNIIRNEKYAGNALLQKFYIEDHLTKKKRINLGEKTRYLVEGTHDPIVDPDTFAATQEIIRAHDLEKSLQAPKSFSCFTSHLRCSKCGKNFLRITTKGQHKWLCATNKKYGKAACAAKRIPEDTLKQVSAQVLGIAEFDEQVFARRIDHVDIFDDNLLTFYFMDGSSTAIYWQDRSRAESWTPEMKERASQLAKDAWRKRK